MALERTSSAGGSHTTTELVVVHAVDGDERVASMKACWEPEQTLPGSTPAP